ncbi:MAG TPA: ATP-binding protein [Candidatus Binatia bacterium]|jgi:signal transduction histidine kinase|nr:ATP-binding protein [Candidatus Binatia bacterium]
MSAERLRFSTAVLRLLGEELNPNPDQGILELVKNAYDADALSCHVFLEEAHLPGGTIRVVDDGDGMLPEQIRDGWLVVGESEKSITKRSPGGRLFVGSKGLGRLGALRLGRGASLVTRPKAKPNIEYCLQIDWDKFDRAQLVEQIELEVTERKRTRGAGKGTEIVIEHVTFAWRPDDVRRLARAMVLLADPFGEKIGFQPTLETKEFAEVVQRAGKGYFSDCDYHVRAKVDSAGHGSAEVTNAAGHVLFHVPHRKLADDEQHSPYRTPPVTFELWEFALDGKRFSTRNVGITELRKWLGEFGGVHVYHRGIRAAPYGDSGNDWLDMNLRRVRSPEVRPSTNNSIGRICLEDPKGLFQQKTDRQGFVDNDAYREMWRFASDVLEWMADQRLKQREQRKRAERIEAEKKKTDAERKLQQELQKLPDPVRKPIEQAVAAQKAAHEAELAWLVDERQLYHTLGTVGTTAAAFAHQSNQPLSIILRAASTLDYLLGDPKKPSFPEMSREAVTQVRGSAGALLAFGEVTLKLLQHEKRRRGKQPLHDLIREIMELLQPYLSLRQVKVDYDLTNEPAIVWGSRASYESIFTNLINNSLRAFARQSTTGTDTPDNPNSIRRILFRTRRAGARLFVTFEDNGPGIIGISVEDIWLPGKTTTEEGTGLGLTIVRDAVADLGGTISAEATGALGGAQFNLEFPAKD